MNIRQDPVMTVFNGPNEASAGGIEFYSVVRRLLSKVGGSTRRSIRLLRKNSN
jgi:hypothetical protein